MRRKRNVKKNKNSKNNQIQNKDFYNIYDVLTKDCTELKKMGFEDTQIERFESIKTAIKYVIGLLLMVGIVMLIGIIIIGINDTEIPFTYSPILDDLTMVAGYGSLLACIVAIGWNTYLWYEIINEGIRKLIKNKKQKTKNEIY